MLVAIATVACGALVVPVVRELSESECAQDVLCIGTMPEAHLSPGIMFVGDSHAPVIGGNQFEDAEATFDAASSVPWGLDCIDQKKHAKCKPDGAALNFLYDGTGTVVYSLDTGVDCRRIRRYQSCTTDEPAATFDGADNGLGDRNGHGTAMARIASTMAEGAALVSVPVLNSNGRGSLSRVLYGLHRVLVLHANQTAPGIILAALSTGPMATDGVMAALLRQAVRALLQLNVVTVVSAGNKAVDACSVLPAGLEDVITTAALLKNTKMAKFSNWGPCADVYAPANAVTGGRSYSGTSVSAAYAAGVAAAVASSNVHVTAAQVARAVVSNASHYKVKKARGTPQLFVHLPRRKSPSASDKTLTRYKKGAVIAVFAVLCAASCYATYNIFPKIKKVEESQSLLLYTAVPQYQ